MQSYIFFENIFLEMAYQKLRSVFFYLPPITYRTHADYVATLAPCMYTYIQPSIITQLGCGYAVIYLSVQRAINECLSLNHLVCEIILMTSDFTGNIYPNYYTT